MEQKTETGAAAVTERQIPLLDLRAQHAKIREEVLAEVIRIIDSQKFILGEEVRSWSGRSRITRARGSLSRAGRDRMRCTWRSQGWGSDRATRC